MGRRRPEGDEVLDLNDGIGQEALFCGVVQIDNRRFCHLRPDAEGIMSDQLPRTTNRELQFQNGTAIGMSHRWQGGQYCSILTKVGIVGCGIYDLKTPAEFGQAIAICKGTPAQPLTEPEDLFDSKIVGCTPKAESLGIRVGMTGREAVELMLKAGQI